MWAHQPRDNWVPSARLPIFRDARPKHPNSILITNCTRFHGRCWTQALSMTGASLETLRTAAFASCITIHHHAVGPSPGFMLPLPHGGPYHTTHTAAGRRRRANTVITPASNPKPRPSSAHPGRAGRSATLHVQSTEHTAPPGQTATFGLPAPCTPGGSHSSPSSGCTMPSPQKGSHVQSAWQKPGHDTSSVPSHSSPEVTLTVPSPHSATVQSVSQVADSPHAIPQQLTLGGALEQAVVHQKLAVSKPISEAEGYQHLGQD